jgi:ParB family chromosome partitioning protein
MSTWDFSAAGVNGLLNNTSKSKMKITMIPYEDIMRNKKNHYSIEDIESLAASISDVGLREPLEVKPLDDGQYMLIDGERRYTAIGQLRAEGNTQYDLVPCIVVDVQGIDLPLSDELKELYVLTTTNAEQREKTDYDLMLQVQNLSRIYTELKAAGYPLRGRQRDMIADKLGISPTQVQRYSSINKNLDEDLKENFKEGKMPLTVASAAAALPKEKQAALKDLTLEKGEITQKDVDQVASIDSSSSLPQKVKKEDDQAEVTVNTDFLQGLKGQVQELQYDLSNGGISVSQDQEARLRNLMDKAVKALNQIQKIVEESK